MNNVVHYIYCICAALVAAEPGIEAAAPVVAPFAKMALAVCAAVMLALHYADPTDASASTPEPAPAVAPKAQ